MDLSPPALTRSPSSPVTTSCSSERSSLGYPSPGLEQQYKISPIYDAPCSVPTSMEGETALPPLDAMHQSDWNATTVMHSSSTTAAMPSLISGEYESFGGYESPLPPPYTHDVYPSHAAQAHHQSAAAVAAHAHAHAHVHAHAHANTNTHAHAHAHAVAAAATPTSTSTPPPTSVPSRSPATSITRMPLAYPSSTSMPSSLTPRVKMEAASEFGQGMEVTHYPSPRSVQSSYPGESGTAYASPAAGYISDSGSSSWHKSDFQPMESDQFYSLPTQSSAWIAESRRPYRLTRPRRAPRRLTTKEEANFQCEIKGCGKLFSRSYNFKAHMETHDEKREYPFPCPIGDCNKKFVRKTDLQRHHQSVHMKERNHKCDYCNRMFARKDTLRRHMEDGCSKRFDIGTLDLRADGYDSLNPSTRPFGAAIGHLVPPTGGLPPMAIPPLGSSGIHTSIPPSMRSRDLLAGGDHTSPGHSWGR